MRIWTACKMTLVLTLLVGIGYPLVMVALGHLLFPQQAEGSLVVSGGQVIGSMKGSGSRLGIAPQSVPLYSESEEH